MLIAYIKHRETSTNIKVKVEEGRDSPSRLVSILDNEDERENNNDEDKENCSIKITDDIEIPDDIQREPCTPQPPRKKQRGSTPSTRKRTWSKFNKPSSIDEQLSKSLKLEINKAIKETESENRDQETLYCLSLVSRLKAFDGRMKSMVRFQIEKVFHEAECGTNFNYSNIQAMTQ